MDMTATAAPKIGRPRIGRKIITVGIDPDVLAVIDAIPYGTRPEKLARLLRIALKSENLLT